MTGGSIDGSLSATTVVQSTVDASVISPQDHTLPGHPACHTGVTPLRRPATQNCETPETWATTETDPQRQAILAAADRLLAGTPQRSSGNLSVVQLAVEAQVKYWVVAQRHTDLRDHFKAHARAAATTRRGEPDLQRLRAKHDQLRQHCAGLEQLLESYATVINELALENQTLRGQLAYPRATVIALPQRGHRPPADSGSPDRRDRRHQ
jgi:hypothetical protein